MDHLDAKRLQAAEKYVLGELPPELRDEYEEHYFDCADCAEDIKAASAFVGASKEIFREEPAPVVRVPAAKPSVAGFSGWFAGLRPAIAVPVMASLVAIIAYQNIPGMHGTADRAASIRGGDTSAQAFGPSFRVQGSMRGDDSEPSKIIVGPQEAFALDFDFTPSQTFSGYEARLLDESGNTLLHGKISGDLTNKEVHLPIPAGLVHPGLYTLQVVGENGTTSSQGAGQHEVQRLKFATALKQ